MGKAGKGKKEWAPTGRTSSDVAMRGSRTSNDSRNEESRGALNGVKPTGQLVHPPMGGTVLPTGGAVRAASLPTPSASSSLPPPLIAAVGAIGSQVKMESTAFAQQVRSDGESLMNAVRAEFEGHRAAAAQQAADSDGRLHAESAAFAELIRSQMRAIESALSEQITTLRLENEMLRTQTQKSHADTKDALVQQNKVIEGMLADNHIVSSSVQAMVAKKAEESRFTANHSEVRDRMTEFLHAGHWGNIESQKDARANAITGEYISFERTFLQGKLSREEVSSSLLYTPLVISWKDVTSELKSKKFTDFDTILSFFSFLEQTLQSARKNKGDTLSMDDEYTLVAKVMSHSLANNIQSRLGATFVMLNDRHSYTLNNLLAGLRHICRLKSSAAIVYSGKWEAFAPMGHESIADTLLRLEDVAARANVKLDNFSSEVENTVRLREILARVPQLEAHLQRAVDIQKHANDRMLRFVHLKEAVVQGGVGSDLMFGIRKRTTAAAGAVEDKGHRSQRFKAKKQLALRARVNAAATESGDDDSGSEDEAELVNDAGNSGLAITNGENDNDERALEVYQASFPSQTDKFKALKKKRATAKKESGRKPKAGANVKKLALLCSNCGEKGHSSYECTKPKMCFICKSPDHLARACPKRSEVKLFDLDDDTGLVGAYAEEVEDVICKQVEADESESSESD